MKSVKFFAIIALLAVFSTKALSQDFKDKDGLKYKIFGNHKGPKPVIGNQVMVDMLYYGENDSLVFNSIEKKQLIPIPIQKSQFAGDLMAGIQMMSVGDSALFLINGDSVAKLAGPNGHIKPGSKLKYIIVLRSIQDPNEQAKIDDGIITDYIKTNKMEGVKHTADGLYYKITQEGTGPLPNKGDSVTAHYTGKFLDGKVFDTDAGRPGPGFAFPLGYRHVIDGWDEAFALMNKGTKATIIIPSKLAYGARATGPIPANAVLLFDVELVSIKSMK